MKDETGATSVEYGIVVSAIAAVIMLAVYLLGGNVLGLFNSVPPF